MLYFITTEPNMSQTAVSAKADMSFCCKCKLQLSVGRTEPKADE